jgi:phage tail-like protein
MHDVFTAFNYQVVITLDDAAAPLCEAAFSQVDGLELTAGTKTIRAGGDNGRQIHLAAPVGNGTLSLKRGMSPTFDLWEWFERVHLDEERHLRATTEVVMLAADGVHEQVAFRLERCLPTKLRVPGLDAVNGQLAIEELSVAYESLRLRRPAATGGG